MKTLLVNYALVLLVVLFSCQDDKKSTENQQKTPTTKGEQVSSLTAYEDSLLNLTKHSEDFYKDLRENKNNFQSNPYIDRTTARDRISLYKLLQRLRHQQSGISSYNPKKDIYGFTFNLDNIKDFLSKIESHNTNQSTPTELIITGLRAYKSYRYINNVLVPEIFLVPVVGNGDNYYAVDDDLNIPTALTPQILEKIKVSTITDDMILDLSFPCPNQCDPPQ